MAKRLANITLSVLVKTHSKRPQPLPVFPKEIDGEKVGISPYSG